MFSNPILCNFLLIRCKAYLRFYYSAFRAVAVSDCCGESMTIEDVIHVEPSIYPSVPERASSWNHYMWNCSSISHMLHVVDHHM